MFDDFIRPDEYELQTILYHMGNVSNSFASDCNSICHVYNEFIKRFNIKHSIGPGTNRFLDLRLVLYSIMTHVCA